MSDPATPWIWDDKSKRWRERKGGRYIGPARLDDLRQGYIESQKAAARDLVARLAGGMTVQQFELEMRAIVKDTYLANYMLAKGGRQNMTSADYGRVGALCRTQYQYLHDFAGRVASGELSLAQIGARASAYMQSSTQAHEKGKAAGRGLTLPAYPGDGSTVCKYNCRCSWRIEEKETEWLCYWTLSPAEHCETCLSRGAAWSPYTVSKDIARSMKDLRRLLRALV